MNPFKIYQRNISNSWQARLPVGERMTDLDQIGSVFSTPDSPRAKPLVLVTDDHEDTRLLLRTMLGFHGCSVIEAADGEEAVSLAENANPDLILMDSTLPRLDGVAATKRIRSLNNGRGTPIVFICGRAEPNFRDTALNAGCDEFLVKPVSFDLLVNVLEKHLGIAT